MSMHEVHVSVVSPEEASYGVAEFWSGGRLIGFTHFDAATSCSGSSRAMTAPPWSSVRTDWPTPSPRPTGCSRPREPRQMSDFDSSEVRTWHE
jgi:hypothetical protein